MYDHTFYKQVQISRSDIRPHIKVGCQPGDFAYDHFNLPPGFVWVYMGEHTHFITQRGELIWSQEGDSVTWETCNAPHKLKIPPAGTNNKGSQSCDYRWLFWSSSMGLCRHILVNMHAYQLSMGCVISTERSHGSFVKPPQMDGGIRTPVVPVTQGIRNEWFTPRSCARECQDDLSIFKSMLGCFSCTFTHKIHQKNAPQESH